MQTPIRLFHQSSHWLLSWQAISDPNNLIDEKQELIKHWPINSWSYINILTNRFRLLSNGFIKALTDNFSDKQLVNQQARGYRTDRYHQYLTNQPKLAYQSSVLFARLVVCWEMITNDHCLLVIAMFIICIFWEKRNRGESRAVNKQDFDLILLIHRIGGNRKRA